MTRSVWKSAAVALGAVLAASTSAPAQDQTVRLGGSTSMFKNAPAADTMTLGGHGTIDASVDADTELTRGYARGGWGGGVRVGVGGRGGWGGVRVGIGWGGRGGWNRGWGGGYRVGWGWGGGWNRGWGWGGGWGGTRVVVGFPVRPIVISGYSSGFCGIAATPVDLTTQAIPLNSMAQSSPVPVIRIPANQLSPMLPSAEDRTFPYDGGPKQPIPPPIPQPLNTPRATPSPEPIPQADNLRVVLQRDDPNLLNLKYVYKAYGEK